MAHTHTLQTVQQVPLIETVQNAQCSPHGWCEWEVHISTVVEVLMWTGMIPIGFWHLASVRNVGTRFREKVCTTVLPNSVRCKCSQQWCRWSPDIMLSSVASQSVSVHTNSSHNFVLLCLPLKIEPKCSSVFTDATAALTSFEESN